MKSKPYKRIRDISDKERDAARFKIKNENSVKTICQLIRDIYQQAVKNNDLWTANTALDIYCYAKRMNDALRNMEATKNYDDGWWEKKEDEKDI